MEWGGKWKPLQYSVARSFAPVTATFSGFLARSEHVYLWCVYTVTACVY